MRNMHGYALSGFILHVPRKVRVLEERENSLHTGNGRIVSLLRRFSRSPSHDPTPKSPNLLSFFIFYFFFFVRFQTSCSHESLHSRVQRSPIFFFYKETRKSSKIHEYIFPVRIFPPFQKNFAYLSRNKRYAGQLNNLGERLGATSNG